MLFSLGMSWFLGLLRSNILFLTLQSSMNIKHMLMLTLLQYFAIWTCHSASYISCIVVWQYLCCLSAHQSNFSFLDKTCGNRFSLCPWQDCSKGSLYSVSFHQRLTCQCIYKAIYFGEIWVFFSKLNVVFPPSSCKGNIGMMNFYYAFFGEFESYIN